MIGLCSAYINSEGTKQDFNIAEKWCKNSYNTTNNKEVKQVSSMLMGHIYFNKNNFKNAKLWYLKELKNTERTKEKGEISKEIADKYFNTKNYTTSAF